MERFPSGINLNDNILICNRLSFVEDKPSLDVLNFLNSILSKSQLFLVVFSREKYGVIYSKNPLEFLKFREIFNKENLKLFFENYNHMISNITVAFFKEEPFVAIKKILDFNDKISKEYKIELK
jgi:hypothetical protein